MIYLHTTAMLQLIAHNQTLTDYLAGHDNRVWFTSALTRTELFRATAHMPATATEHAHHILDGLDTVHLTDRLLTHAATLDPAPPNTLHALHIASALTAGLQLHTFITYDHELAADAAAHSITTVHPERGLP